MLQLEHNFFHDVNAARQVLDSNVNITLVPADVCNGFRIEADFLCDLDSSFATRYIAQMAKAWRIYRETSNLRGNLLQALQQYERKAFEMTGGRQSQELPGSIRDSLDFICDYRRVSQDYSKAETFYRIFKGFLTSVEQPDQLKPVAQAMINSEVKVFSVSDAYVVYSLMHPDRTERQRTGLEIGANGEMKTVSGDKYEIVRNIDYKHFSEVLTQALIRG